MLLGCMTRSTARFIRTRVRVSFSYSSAYVSYITNNLFSCSADEHGAFLIGARNSNIYADENFALPDTITVTMGGSALNQGTDFTWNKNAGELYIPNITGDLVVTITAELDGVDYTQCEYIQSSGTQYIDTGVTGDQNTAMEASFAKLSPIGLLVAVFVLPAGYGKVVIVCRVQQRQYEMQYTGGY
jgi:hypothetical protein